MLSLPFIDIKTGQVLIERSADGVECVKTKQVENSYLEHWLKTHQIESSQLWVGKFYGVSDADTTCDRQRLEAEGKYLVFTNGKDGYFADAKTAKLMAEGDGDRNIHPIFADDQDSPHNLVAYGSLVLSDGIAATALGREEQPVKILMIDDEQRSHGEQPLVDVEGKPIPPEQLQKLYDKMGDGTMLLSRWVFERLIEPQEREAIAATSDGSSGHQFGTN